MTPEDITEIITRRLDNLVKEGFKWPIQSIEFDRLSERIDELTKTLGEIRALKENETKNNQVN